MANIKYIGNDTNTLEKGKVHVDNGTHTGCGAKISDNPEEWETTSTPVTCQKNGCKN